MRATVLPLFLSKFGGYSRQHLGIFPVQRPYMKKNIFYYCLVPSLFAFSSLFWSCSKNHPANNPIVITSYYPDSAGMGDTVTIYGKNLPADLSTEKILINNKTLTVISSSPDSLKIVI